jgi:hypothetical protein
MIEKDEEELFKYLPRWKFLQGSFFLYIVIPVSLWIEWKWRLFIITLLLALLCLPPSRFLIPERERERERERESWVGPC